MGKVYYCVGRYASNPYTIKNVGTRVYCVEELCYYIRHNALFIEDDFFENYLFSWLEEECNLPSLVRKIKARLRLDNRVETAVRELFENVNYCTKEETEETITLLRSNRDMSLTERLKIHGDFFLKNNKLSLACETYQKLLLHIDKRKKPMMLAEVYKNMGIIFARLFMLEDAGLYFKKAYELNAADENMIYYLITLRLRLSDELYLKELSTLDAAYEFSSLVEEKLEKVRNEYSISKENDKLRELRTLKLEGNIKEFDKMSLKITSDFKEEYRDLMQK